MRRVAVACAAAAATAASAPAAAPTKPNIVVLFIDDYGWADFGGNGALPISETPNLDRLAGTGMRFTDFHSTPLCTPSRAQLLTGRYAGRHGVYKNFAPDSIGGLNTSEITLGEFMKGAGYATAMRESAGEHTGVGKWRNDGWVVSWMVSWVGAAQPPGCCAACVE